MLLCFIFDTFVYCVLSQHSAANAVVWLSEPFLLFPSSAMLEGKKRREGWGGKKNILKSF